MLKNGHNGRGLLLLQELKKNFSEKHSICQNYVPPYPEAGGYIVFGADPVGVGVSIAVYFFVSVRYLLNQILDFDKTCIYTMLGGEKELI